MFCGRRTFMFFVIIKVYYGKSPAIDDGASCLSRHFIAVQRFFGRPPITPPMVNSMLE